MVLTRQLKSAFAVVKEGDDVVVMVMVMEMDRPGIVVRAGHSLQPEDSECHRSHNCYQLGSITHF